MATVPRALPVRFTEKSWRNMVVEADPDFVTESQNPVEYQFGGDRIIKRGYTSSRGAYAGD